MSEMHGKTHIKIYLCIQRFPLGTPNSVLQKAGWEVSAWQICNVLGVFVIVTDNTAHYNLSLISFRWGFFGSSELF
jgi:hypothetical protein